MRGSSLAIPAPAQGSYFDLRVFPLSPPLARRVQPSSGAPGGPVTGQARSPPRSRSLLMLCPQGLGKGRPEIEAPACFLLSSQAGRLRG